VDAAKHYHSMRATVVDGWRGEHLTCPSVGTLLADLGRVPSQGCDIRLRINDQWRITFRIEDNRALDVTIEDYH
jgi:hypothetical protein